MAQNNENLVAVENSVPEVAVTTLSKNQQRKMARLERLESYKQKRRLRQKEIRKAKQKDSANNQIQQIDSENPDGSCCMKRREFVAQLKQETREKLLKAQNSSPKVCVDLG